MNKLSYEYPLKNHNEYFQNLEYKDHYVENSWILIPSKLLKLIKNFIIFKTSYGSNVEQSFYKNKDTSDIIRRLFKNRPLSFLGGSDSWLLKNSTSGYGKWETIGTDSEKEPLLLNNYMSYDEIELSSFLSLSIFTPFINKGARNNGGCLEPDCQQNGIYIGQSGARFERYSKMEWRYMAIDKDQNTIKNGYGPNNNTKKAAFLSIWADFYDIPYFPLFTEAETDTTGRYHKLNTGTYLDLLIYKKRVKINAEIFLKEANNRAKKINKKAFCYVVGLGLGAWKISDIQNSITIKTYLELIKENAFGNLSDLYFGWFDKTEINIPEQLNGVKIHIGKRNPADPLNDKNKLLVANWAWDPNSYVGNEYWLGQLRTSGDPAAACSSFVAYIGNPDLCNITEVHSFNTNC